MIYTFQLIVKFTKLPTKSIEDGKTRSNRYKDKYKDKKMTNRDETKKFYLPVNGPVLPT